MRLFYLRFFPDFENAEKYKKFRYELNFKINNSILNYYFPMVWVKFEWFNYYQIADHNSKKKKKVNRFGGYRIFLFQFMNIKNKYTLLFYTKLISRKNFLS